MEKSESIAKLAEALSKAQVEIKAAKFNSVNPFLHNKYADLGAVIDAAKQPLANHGLAVSQPVSIDETGICVETILMHSSGEWITSRAKLPMIEEKGKSSAQVAGSIITYLRRYSLAAVVGVYADEDTDGNDTKQERKQEQKQAAPSPASQSEQKQAAPSPASQPEQKQAQPAQMTIGEAMNEQSSDGHPYGGMETPDLVNRLNAMRKAKGTDKEKPEHARKMNAIQVILADRNNK